MVISLDKERLKVLLREADDRVFNRGKKLNYEQHLEITADHIAKNYNRSKADAGHKAVTH